jgi:hypothetical protein
VAGRGSLRLLLKIDGQAVERHRAAAVELTLEHFGGSERLGKFAHVRVRLVSKSKNAAVVQAEKAAPLNLVRAGSSWLVAGAAPATAG